MAAGPRGRVIRRRDLILGFGATAAWPFAARFACSPSWAQQRSGMKRIGCLFSAPSDAPHQVALRDALKRAGFIEGENLSMDWRGYGLQVEQFDDHAAELARSGVDLILAGGDAAVRAAQRATKEIPILALTDDMLGKGFVRSLAKPGNNTTGVTILASELDGKRQEILVQLVPGASRIGALVDTNMATASHIGELKAAARAQGIELSVHAVSRPEEIPSSLMRRENRAPWRSMCWRRRSSTTMSRSFSNTWQQPAYPRCTNGRKWRVRAA